MAEEEQTLDLTTIGNGEESNVEGSVEENNEEAERVAAEEAAAAQAEAERVAAEEPSQTKDEGVLTYDRLVLIKRRGAPIYDRDRKVILENLSGRELTMVNNAEPGMKDYLMRQFINSSMIGK